VRYSTPSSSRPPDAHTAVFGLEIAGRRYANPSVYVDPSRSVTLSVGAKLRYSVTVCVTAASGAARLGAANRQLVVAD
jgi:hypothetical protein